MNFLEIKTVAQSYADREKDVEVTNNMDNFLRIVEARINRQLTVQKMSMRTSITTIADQEYYGLPLDFEGLRDIEVRDIDDSRARTNLEYLAPEQMNTATGFSAESSNLYYTIIANQLQISPPQDGRILELVYYRKLPALSSTEDTNWMSLDNPDCYVFGLMVEINSFVKDAQAMALWNERFQQALNEIEQNDADTRWSGPALTIKRG